MFTGIVRERGRVAAAEQRQNGQGVTLRIDAPATAAVSKPGDSISVAGCCLTATAVESGSLEFDAVPETIARSNLGRLAEGAEVNLEPALRVGEPLGGHFVQGHVDGVEIALVPFTLQETTLSALVPGDEVNVEVDLLAKYAERLASS